MTTTLTARDLSGCFTALITPFRNGLVDETALREALVDAWLACAPVTLARDFLGRE